MKTLYCRSIPGRSIILLAVLLLMSFCRVAAADSPREAWLKELGEIEQKVNRYVADPAYPDDPFILATIKEAIAGSREENGGIGACLVRENTGEIVEMGHNRQFEPHYRSDLHAEMDLLTRYEERVKASRPKPKGPPTTDSRKLGGLVLYTSVEPCPMCLTRIINTGLTKVLWAADDPTGGMGRKISDLPQFWQEMAKGKIYEPARCSPELRSIAKRLFRPMAMQRPK